VSLRAVIAAWGTPPVEFVGQSSVGAASTVVPVPAGAREGDYCAILYFPSRTFSGGSGSAWTILDVMTATAKLAHRRLEAADITTSLTMNDVTPIITIVYRGVNALSAERTSVAFTGTSTTMTGFTKSANAASLIGLIHGTGDSGTLSLSDSTGVDWAGAATQGPDAWFEGMYYMAAASDYVNGSDFAVNASVTVANKYASVIELLI
jgi:hypothetical protein